MKTLIRFISFSFIACLFLSVGVFGQQRAISREDRLKVHRESPDSRYPVLTPGTGKRSPGYRYDGPGFMTKQVNVDANGENILGDAANEPSIAVDPTNSAKMVIGWRQFDDVNNSFRQAGYGYSSDGGVTWTFPGVIEPTIFRSDPVLGFDASGKFFYNSLTNVTGDYTCKVFGSTDGGATWDAGTDAHGGDKQWMTIDRSGGPGNGNVYSAWNSAYTSCSPGFFTRSADAGNSYEDCIEVDGNPYWGTMAVGPSGELYIGGAGSFDGVQVVKSTNAQIPGSTINWTYATQVDMDGYIVGSDPINPVGILGQVYVDVDRSNGPGRGNVYVVASVARLSVADHADVMFAMSNDGGATFSSPQRLNTDPSTNNYQWFATMSVAPNGRIDVIWLDTRDDVPGGYLSSLYYCYSDDQGQTWSINKRLSDQFDPTVGYPQQAKMGDYFDMVSDNEGAHLAWASTLNGEQDVYYTHIVPNIVGLPDVADQQKPANLTVSPNPFRTSTFIRYSVPCDCFINITFSDVYGNTIRAIAAAQVKAGSHLMEFADETLAPGFYLCRLSTGSQVVTARMIKVE